MHDASHQCPWRGRSHVSFFAHQKQLIQSTEPMRVSGKLSGSTGLMMLADGLRAPVGTMCSIFPRYGGPVDAQVVGFRNGQSLLMPLGGDQGLSNGDRVETSAARKYVPLGRQMLGRVVNGRYREPARPVRALTVSDVHVLGQSMVQHQQPSAGGGRRPSM